MNVVIAGGGFCGASIAKHLESTNHLCCTLIDTKPYFEYTPSTLYCLTNPDYANKIKLPYHRFLPQTTIIPDEIQTITPTTVTTKNQTLQYDYAVICTGSTYPIFLPSTTQVYTVNTINDILKLSKALESATSVLIIGGGYIGVETAAQLATQYQNLSITLVDSESTLLTRSPPQASVYATRFLKKHNLKIIHNQKVIDHPTPTTYILSDGTGIDADVCIWCAGIQTDSSFLDTTLSSCVDNRGRIMVNSCFQIPTHPHMFAGGDICNISEEKTAQHAHQHADIIASNIVSLSQNKPLKQYKPKPSPQLISLGEYRGILQLNDTVVYSQFLGLGKKLIEWYTIARLTNKRIW